MGVLYDYFRAPGTAVALAVADRPGGPLDEPGDEFAVDGVATKWIDPHVVLGRLVASILQVPWNPALVSTVSVWPPEEGKPQTLEEYNDLPEDSPWQSDQFVEQLSTEVRDTLAGVDDARLHDLAAEWARIEEFSAFTSIEPGWLPALVHDLVALARRARQAGDQLFCWSSL